MGANRKRKYESGEGARYMSRSKAMKFLQLRLNDFRRICILKGVYPREPKNRKRAQQGCTAIRTLYLKKDIQFLYHEPNIWKLREMKVIFDKIRRARALRERDDETKWRERFPVLKLDRIVKERYPTFIDAVRDLDDCLTLLFLFASFPKTPRVPEKIINMCRRLTVEFMLYVIAAKALRKVFISIKGYYYQAEIKGQLVTWIVPHQFVITHSHCIQVDFKVMMDFVDFYSVVLGFVNFRLYHSLNLAYPPSFSRSTHEEDDDSYASDRIAALNVDLSRIGSVIEEYDEDAALDEFSLCQDKEKVEELRRESERKKKVKTLFKGLKFFINREVPREALVFVIKSCGGEVSWENTSFIGATYDESDETITHQIVDRPKIDKQFISRYYVQPQWIFDCVNTCQLLPVEKYFIGVMLPPHLSPFRSEHKLDKYVPPEEKALSDPALADKLARYPEEEEEEETDEDDDYDYDDLDELDDEEDEEQLEDEMDGDLKNTSDKKTEEEIEDEEIITEQEKMRLEKKKLMSVKTGEIIQEDPYAKRQLDRDAYRLRVSMIKNKHRKLYHSMIAGRSKRSQEAWLLRKKRRRIDEAEKEMRKHKKRAKAMAQ